VVEGGKLGKRKIVQAVAGTGKNINGWSWRIGGAIAPSSTAIG